MGLFKLKKETIIDSVNTVDVDGVDIYVVSWAARYGSYSSDRKSVAKAFLNKEDADKFVRSLKDAAELIQYTEDLYIKIEKQK